LAVFSYWFGAGEDALGVGVARRSGLRCSEDHHLGMCRELLETFRLLCDRALGGGRHDGVTEEATDFGEAGLRWLEIARKGRVLIPVWWT
jgi:hypothetical protein